MAENGSLKPLLKVDKRYNSKLTTVNLKRHEIEVEVQPGVQVTQDGFTKDGGPVSLSQSGIRRRQPASLVPALAL